MMTGKRFLFTYREALEELTLQLEAAQKIEEGLRGTYNQSLGNQQLRIVSACIYRIHVLIWNSPLDEMAKTKGHWYSRMGYQ